MNLLQETRVVLTLILLACIGLIATAFYMEYQLGLEPCPMCIVQRIAVALAGAAALIGIWLGFNLLRGDISLVFAPNQDGQYL